MENQWLEPLYSCVFGFFQCVPSAALLCFFILQTRAAKHRFRISRALNRQRGRNTVDLLEIGGRQRDGERGQIFLKPLELARTKKGNNPRLLREQIVPLWNALKHIASGLSPPEDLALRQLTRV